MKQRYIVCRRRRQQWVPIREDGGFRMMTLVFLMVLCYHSLQRIVLVSCLNVDYIIGQLQGVGSMVQQLRSEISHLYNDSTAGCINTTNCIYKNYDQCQSKPNNPTCQASQGQSDCSQYYYDTTAMTNSSTMKCSTLFDYDASTVRIPPNLMSLVFSQDNITMASNDNDADTTATKLESICTTLLLDGWLQKQYSNSQSDDSVIIKPLQMHYGDRDGIHRIYPGRASTDPNCPTKYDPRKRPWYAASSTGKKNIVLLIDQTMDSSRLSLLQAAATYIVDTTNIADAITIITFSNTAVSSPLGTSFYKADYDSQNELKQMIQELQLINASEAATTTSSSYPNYSKAFEYTISVIQRATIFYNFSSYCSTAVLLFTDDDTYDNQKIQQAAMAIQNIQPSIQFIRNIAVFGIVLSSNVTHDINIACASFPEGVWSHVIQEDTFDPIILRHYYEYYELGLSLLIHEDDASDSSISSFVEPYTFFSFGINGTTVSTPVYDPRYSSIYGFQKLLGVASVDYSIQDFQQATELSYDDVYSRIVEISKQADDKTCPNMMINKFNRSIMPYDLEFFTTYPYQKYALCANNSTMNITTNITTTFHDRENNVLVCDQGNNSSIMNFRFMDLWNNTYLGNQSSMFVPYRIRGCCSNNVDNEEEVCLVSDSTPIQSPTMQTPTTPINTNPNDSKASSSHHRSFRYKIFPWMLMAMLIHFSLFL